MHNDTVLVIELISSFLVSIYWGLGSVLMREKRSPLVHWSICSGLIGLGVWLIYEQGILANSLTYGLSSFAILLGFFGIQRGIRRFGSFDKQIIWDIKSSIIFVVSILLVITFRFGMNYPAMSVMIFSIAAGYSLISSGKDATTYLRRQFGWITSLSVGSTLYIAGSLFFVRAFFAIMFPEQRVETLQTKTSFNSAFLVSMFIMHLMMNLSLAGIVVAKLISDIRHLSISDSLTGLSNRRFLEESLELETSRFRRWGRPFSVLMIDIDHFKTINDTHGHDVGDDVLRCAAKVIKDSARKNDITGRWGGEEFFMILPETAEDGSYVFAERLRASIEKNTVIHNGNSIKVTASLGLATSGCNQMTWRDLVKLADAAMYRAKKNGRNRVEVAVSTSQGNVIPLRANSI